MGGSGAISGLKKIQDEYDKSGFNEKAFEKSLSGIISKNINLDYEVGYCIDLDGNIIGKPSIGVSDEILTMSDTTDKISVHNHPKGVLGLDGGPISDGDIGWSINHNEYMTVAFDQHRIYSIRKINWQAGQRNRSLRFAEEYRDAIQRFHDKATQKATDKADDGYFDKNGRTDWDKYTKYLRATWYHSLRVWLRNNAKYYGYEYKERMIAR